MNPDKTLHRINDISLSQAAIISGTCLLLMAIIAPIANFLIIEGLVVEDDAALTLSNITSSEGLFRLGIGIFLLVAVLDIIIAWALYIFLKPVKRSLSLLTAWFRLVYATLLAFVLIFLISVLQYVSGAEYLTAFETGQREAHVLLLIKNFTFGWGFSLIIFGFHLLLLGYLFFKAGYMRKILGILLVLAGMGYAIDGFGGVLFSDYDLTISLYTFIGEIILIFWLLIRGRKIQEKQDTISANQ